MKKVFFLLALTIPTTDGFMPRRPLVSRNLNVHSMSTDSEETAGVFADEVQQEAKEVLEKVGWASPIDDGEMTSEDPFVKQIDAGIKADYGFGLDDLLNPAKVCSERTNCNTCVIKLIGFLNFCKLTGGELGAGSFQSSAQSRFLDR